MDRAMLCKTRKKSTRFIFIFLVIVITSLVSYTGYVAFYSVTIERLPLSEPLVSIDSPEGQARLHRALASDWQEIEPYFQPQHLRTTCGIATGVSVINALQRNTQLSQDEFLTHDVAAVKSPWLVRVAGISLSELNSTLEHKGAHTHIHFASTESATSFRASVNDALVNSHSVVIVNYSRVALDQAGSGHISPIGAYDPVSDSVLVMDVAVHKYPFTWVPLPVFFDSMNTVAPGENESRGWLEVSI